MKSRLKKFIFCFQTPLKKLHTQILKSQKRKGINLTQSKVFMILNYCAYLALKISTIVEYDVLALPNGKGEKRMKENAEQKRKSIHPGTVLLEDIMKPLGLTITEATKILEIEPKVLSELIVGNIALSPDMAIRIAKATNTSAKSWMNMQRKLSPQETK